jgi:hypothetical protein
MFHWLDIQCYSLSYLTLDTYQAGMISTVSEDRCFGRGRLNKWGRNDTVNCNNKKNDVFLLYIRYHYDDRHQVMAIPHMNLWVKWPNNGSNGNNTSDLSVCFNQRVCPYTCIWIYMDINYLLFIGFWWGFFNAFLKKIPFRNMQNIII